MKLWILTTFLLFAATLLVQPGSSKQWSRQKAVAWYKQQTWLSGLKLKPHASIDAVEFTRQYHLHNPFWDSAFAFLRTHDLGKLPKGKYPIMGDDVFASVTEDSTKDFAKTSWESHRKYADIQYVIRGEEQIGVCPVSKATLTQAYDEQHDVAHYAAKGSLYRARHGTFFIFFPSDAHRPNITPGGQPCG